MTPADHTHIMPSSPKAIATIITANYIPQALTLYTYIQESNPNETFVVLLIGEKDLWLNDLPEGPEWIFWEELLGHEARMSLAKEYTPFELCCVVRGRFHHFLATSRQFEKWALIDSDIGVLASLEPIWNSLESASIALTLHACKPVDIQYTVRHEAGLLRRGLYNAGVVAMKRSADSERASIWLRERLEAYGHSHPHRITLGLASEHDFEFVDQIWLNLLPVYFKDATIILESETCNLGHWNLHQGALEIKGNTAWFNGQRVVIAHFSGLPANDLATVSSHSPLYASNPSTEWAILAAEYLSRLEQIRKQSRLLPYCYAELQPQASIKLDQPPNNNEASIKHSAAPMPRSRHLRSLISPRKVSGLLTLWVWRTQQGIRNFPKRLENTTNSLFTDKSLNAFTELVPCVGNYETYVVRILILKALQKAKVHFRGILLDVGAGSSPYEHTIMATGQVSQYVKLDLEDAAYHRDSKPDLTWDGTSIPLDQESVDTVLMTEVLEHVPNPSSLLTEVRRVLKPSGTLFLTVPFLWPLHELPYDYHRFTPIALKSHLENSGYAVESIEMIGGYDLALAQTIGLWLTNRKMGENKRKWIKLLAWPFYSFLLKLGLNDSPRLRNHQMYVGVACVAKAR